MSKYKDIDDLFDGIENNIGKLADRTLELLNRETSEAMNNAYKEFGEYQQNKIRQIFNEAVDRFYSSYTPHSYVRTYGLYNVLDLKLNDKGTVNAEDPAYMDLFNPDKLHTDRNGNSLFNKVFIEGYHGGAENVSGTKSDIWGAHPSPGNPYYRAPGWVKYPGERKKKWHKYGKWGRSAVQTTSPYEIFSRELEAAEENEILEKFKEISQRHNDSALDKVTRSISELQEEIFG